LPQDTIGGAGRPPWTSLPARRDDGDVTKNRSSTPAESLRQRLGSTDTRLVDELYGLEPVYERGELRGVTAERLD
jgi:hypothetical protein